jgi:squalene-hopene/tetraprenyl-beta-curcumene cyclase
VSFDEPSFRRALAAARQRLLDERTPAGHWVGELATSALSTATATASLALVDAATHRPLISAGLDWLAAHANADGGWGDTAASKSNINTTALCWGAFARAPEPRSHWAAAVANAEAWLTARTGSLQPRRFVDAILAFYGRDRTFSVPILTLLALCGRLGPREQAFGMLPQLPFELAALPHSVWRLLRLPVVSYAMPALVAVGQARHHFVRHWCPFKTAVRDAVRGRTLGVVGDMQASSGGFLEAVPLTSFVTACLASIGRHNHPIVRNAVRFLLDLVRPDGGWPIDTCLSTWVTTLSVNALAIQRPAGGNRQSTIDNLAILQWLLGQQYHYVHPFTHTPPGGWSWMDADGAVPDADDTPGALLALHALAPDDPAALQAAAAGAAWLLELQNRDGGIASFCRGWGKLPFDRSAADLTAHALRAWHVWQPAMPADLRSRLERAIPRAVAYLERCQNADGAWLPLWFGNEWNQGDRNATYGTARVVTALGEAGLAGDAALARGAAWLLRAQRHDGGWGGGPEGPASIEETALAVDALCTAANRVSQAAERGLTGRDARSDSSSGLLAGEAPTPVRGAIRRGIAWLVEHTNEGRDFPPAPIGLYFAKLWYHEKLYPIVWTVSALSKADVLLAAR